MGKEKFITVPINETGILNKFEWFFGSERKDCKTQNQTQNGTVINNNIQWNYNYTCGQNTLMLSTEIKKEQYDNFNESVNDILDEIETFNKNSCGANIICGYNITNNKEQNKTKYIITLNSYIKAQ